MNNSTDGENLPGYKKKSFSLYYNGGEIWFEHLDGIYEYESLVIKKLNEDIPKFTRPSSPAFICFVFDETDVGDLIIEAVTKALLNTDKHFMKVAFCGLERKNKAKLKRLLKDCGFAIEFVEGLEYAKMWLLP